ncbi:MAG: hypothetical protein AMQ22_00366 [Candidatus Methanofastidiosum methylothiophilum]|uniref:Uncharacterized protein n=1 Tax=Candidatus Methanofastidiosum methylothiophilum TaxID=1705564 RepID=A0A150J802_9EURY|nr:MAG: hypothetical protein AMQ22_00366 [Candidatus Methanofastidiosum methylthiophilus]
MARDKTYTDNVDEIKESVSDAKTNPESRKTIELALQDIEKKYGVGAAHKAYDACGLANVGITKPKM